MSELQVNIAIMESIFSTYCIVGVIVWLVLTGDWRDGLFWPVFLVKELIRYIKK